MRRGERGVLWGLFLLLAWALLLAGCGQAPTVRDETDETAYRRGKSLLREDRKAEALHAFLKVIDKRKDAAESHLEAGMIYLDHIQDPILAIYHFNRYLEVRPDAEQSRFVRQLIETAQKQFASRLPGMPNLDGEGRREVLARLEAYQNENLQLKEQFVTLERQAREARAEANAISEENRELRRRLRLALERAQSGGNGNAVRELAPPERRETGQRPSSYEVQGGDTLSKISQAVYGTPARWLDIFQANRDVLPSPHALRVGQELRIP